MLREIRQKDIDVVQVDVTFVHMFILSTNLLLKSSGVKWIAGMSLEARDKLNPTMIAVASVLNVTADQTNVTIHFDEWSDIFDYTTSSK